MLHRKTLRFYSATLLILLVSAAPTLSCAQRQALSEHTRTIYVMGAVKKPGLYVIQDRERVTILKALEISGGLTETADKTRSQIIRHENGSTSFIKVNLTKVVRGKSLDMELVAGDTLFVPDKRFHLYDSPFYDSPPQEINPNNSAFGS
jgi:protein involved in polysaccharide export with SLBB domain